MGHHSGSVGTSQKIMYSDEEDEQHQVLILAGSVEPISNVARYYTTIYIPTTG